MPRPKVHPSQRKRAAAACNFCRTSKKRCSATVPCTACQKRGIEDSCFLTTEPRGGGARRRSSGAAASTSTPPRSNEDDEASRLRGPDWSSGEMSTETGPRAANDKPTLNFGARLGGLGLAQTSASQNARTVESTPRDTPPLGKESHARMLLNLRGERVYIGEAASLSFLEFIRNTVAAQLGPSQFTQSDNTNRMFETEPTLPASNTVILPVPLLSDDDLVSYTQCFQAATGGFLALFSPAELEQVRLIAADDTPAQPNMCHKAALTLVVAIGAQCSSPECAQQFGEAYFRRAQRQAFVGMLEDPNVDLVRAFLLMAFYLLGACRRNTAFMYLGVAARAAVSLGLHSKDFYTDMEPTEHQSRLNIWMSLCVLDMIVSSILGRPPATAGLRSELDQSLISTPDSARDQDTTCLVASYRILSLVNDAIEDLYKKKKASIAHIQEFMTRIEAWSQSLPESLRSSSRPGVEPLPPRSTIASIHVSCLYYFAVTLVTRPILIYALTSRSAPAISPLASACLDAAVFLVQTCVEAHQNRLLLGNMCIMKALVFAAGLILGFDMFAKRELDYEIENAFTGARDILSFLSIQSPQAAHYTEILNSLSNAVKQQRGRQLTRGRSRLVGKIFSLSGPQDTLPVVASDTQESGNSIMTGISFADSDELQAAGQAPYPAGSFDVDIFNTWDTLDLSQWDSFPF